MPAADDSFGGDQNDFTNSLLLDPNSGLFL